MRQLAILTVIATLLGQVVPAILPVGKLYAAEQSKRHRLVGKFQKADSKYSKIAPEGVFFMIVTEKGDTLAFPVTFANSAEKKKVMGALEKTYAVEGESTQLTVVGESSEVEQRVHVLKLAKVEQVALSELRPKISANTEMEVAGKPMQKPTSAKGPTPRSPGVSGVNDTVTNAAIFTAGAILLGSILSK